jgi:ABC-2 type transport system ATP-binding protein
MTASTSAIETRGLSKSFGRTKALAPLDLVIPRGAVFALVGHNGAGKTTLIKLLLNILRPTHGTATVLGESTAKLTGESFTHIGYVSENQELPGWMTVQSMMDYLRPFYPTWDAANLLADLDLPPDRKLSQLSRGMRMKAALASVLAFRPPLIVMDEPFSGLDPLVRDELIKALLGCMNDELDAGANSSSGSGTTILISSHDLAEVESFATHVAFLHQGKLLFAESMTTLTARFREVTVTLAPSGKPSPFTLPSTWLLPESSASVYRFIHTSAETDDLEQQVRSMLPHATAIQSEPMSLRTIFLALARSSQAHDRSRA